jgi:hypothetical protein
MPNTNKEYQRLLVLLNENPQYRTVLDSISKAEGTWGRMPSIHGGGVNTEKM